jgi:hypothetical protein
MDPLMLAAAVQPRSSHPMFSALPDAPTVPYRATPERAKHTRKLVAGGLYRLGDAVAPAPRPATAD